jgi:hypothetical protein
MCFWVEKLGKCQKRKKFSWLRHQSMTEKHNFAERLKASQGRPF